MLDIECLACEKAVKLPQFINTDNYDGQVVCQECKSLLHVKLVKGKAQKYRIVENKFKGFNRPVNIYVQSEKAKELLGRIGERTGKLTEGNDVEGSS